MGCSHCLSDCKPDGQHMSMETFKKAVNFFDNYNNLYVMLSGGEIFEHPLIKDFISIATSRFERVVLITNGDKLSSDENLYNFMKEFKSKTPKEQFFIQVTNDPKYYPKALSEKQQYRLKKLGAMIDVVPNGLYPQGRALQNHSNTDWTTKAPKCANVRLLAKQGFNSLRFINLALMQTGHWCTPVIAPDGFVKLGESALCPNCAHIDDDDFTIIEKIKNFDCQQCKIPFERLKNYSAEGYSILTGGGKDERD